MSSSIENEDIVTHVDILSSPTKNTFPESKYKVMKKTSNSSRHSPRRRISIEQIISPVKKSITVPSMLSSEDNGSLKENSDLIDTYTSSIFERNEESTATEVTNDNGETSKSLRRRTRNKRKTYYNEDSDDAGNENNANSSNDDVSFHLKHEEEQEDIDEYNEDETSVGDIKDEKESLGIELEPKLSTPKKKSDGNKKYSYVSPLKKEILKNLDDDKKRMKGDLKPLQLTKNFKNTPIPNANQYKPPAEKIIGSFFDTFEGYFDQKRSVRLKDKSKNTMAMAKSVTREEFATIINAFNKKHLKSSRDHLFKIQKSQYPQYWFELAQGFSLLFYGIGSKHAYLEDFVLNYLSQKIAYAQIAKNPTCKLTKGIPCIIINGYNPICNYRDVSKDIAKALYPDELNRNETKYWDNHVLLKLQKMVEYYKTQPQDIKLIILIHTLDGPSIRKDTFQVMLSTLAKIRQVAIVASSDNINAPILWDNMKAQDFNFVYHDISNFEPREIESSFQDVMKLGSSDTKNTSEGAKYVLQSLTLNSKKMYRLLLETQLTNVEINNFSKSAKQGLAAIGVEFRIFLSECSNQFIASNEISLRSMLTEFVEHKMANITKDTRGAEKIWIPYSYAEIKKLLNEVLKDI